MSNLRTLTGAALGTLVLANCGAPPAPSLMPPASPDPARVEVGPPAALEVQPPDEPPASAPAAPLPSPLDWRSGDIIVFEAALHGEGQRDLYIYNPRVDTVWAIVEANTEFDEANPKLSKDRNWLVFRRALPHPERGEDQNLLLLDMNTGLLDTLPGVNTGTFNEVMPAISDEGRWILYVSAREDHDRLLLYDSWRHARFDIPVANRDVVRIGDLAFAMEGRWVVYSASLEPDGDLDLYVYDFDRALRWLLPFVQSPFDEDDPDLSADGRYLLFASDRRGSQDIYEADLESGAIDNMVLANTPDGDENSPRFYGKDAALRRFKYFPANRSNPDYYQVRIYDPGTGLLDTVPVANVNFLPLRR